MAWNRLTEAEQRAFCALDTAAQEERLSGVVDAGDEMFEALITLELLCDA